MKKELEIIVCLKCGKHLAVEEGYTASELSCPYCKDDVIYQTHKHDLFLKNKPGSEENMNIDD